MCVCVKPLESKQTFFVFQKAGGSRSLGETRANEDAHAVLAQRYLLCGTWVLCKKQPVTTFPL